MTCWFCGSSHFGVWGWCSKRPGDCGQCRGTTTEHRSSPREPHQPKLARNSDTRTLCSTPKRCNSNGAISTFEIYVGELRATFLRNHNMRRHKDPSRRHPKPGRQPKRKTTQAEDNSSTEDPRNPDSRHNRHKHGGTAPVTWRCTRYVAVHPNRRGALPTDRVQRPNKQEQTRNWHTEPLTATPLHAHLCPTGGGMGTPPTPPPALRPTPAHSDTSYTLKCEEPDNLSAKTKPQTTRLSAHLPTPETHPATQHAPSPTPPHAKARRPTKGRRASSMRVRTPGS